MSELERLQALFWDAARHEPAPPEVDVDFVSRGALSAQARLGLYRTAYWVRQVNALRELFPRVVALLGDGPFARTASRYLGAHPSTSWALEHLGPGFPAWLDAHHGVALAQAARVEWAGFDVFIAPDVAALGREAVDGGTFADARLTVGPHVRAVAVSDEALAALELSTLAQGSPHRVLAVWRSGFEVLRRLVSPAEAQALEAAQAGASVAQVCEVLATEFEEAPALFQVLFAWFERGWVTALSPAH